MSNSTPISPIQGTLKVHDLVVATVTKTTEAGIFLRIEGTEEKLTGFCPIKEISQRKHSSLQRKYPPGLLQVYRIATISNFINKDGISQLSFDLSAKDIDLDEARQKLVKFTSQYQKLHSCNLSDTSKMINQVRQENPPLTSIAICRVHPDVTCAICI
jgi:translation initiation factor 2 alpha subunit (eIF-2alpha)